MRKLFSKRPQPYYIYAPNYRRSSAGIRVLHMLCDALNRSGHEAYVVSRVLNPNLITPYLSNDVIALHRSQGLEPIAVYPEIVDGNPLGAGIVVRYLLNQPGYLGGSGIYEPDDLLFAYSRGLLQPGMPEDNILHLPAIDLSIFCPPANPAKRIPGKVCYYQGRAAQAKVDPGLLPPDAIEITPEFPDSWEGLADLFQQCEYFYLAERSGLAAEAALCGCISIVLPGKYAQGQLSEFENKNYGTAWGNTPEAIERARQTLPLLRQTQLEHQAKFWSALDHFVDVTQQAVRTLREQSKGGEGGRWLASRVLSDVQENVLEAYLSDKTVPTFEVLVLDGKGEPHALARTLDSINALDDRYASIRVTVLALLDVASIAPQVNLEAFQIAAGSQRLELINQRLFESSADWFMVLRAGDELTSSGFLTAALDLINAPALRAVYADEVMRDANGNLDLMLRPDFNLDLLLSLPATMVGHWLFRRDVWQGMGGFVTDYPDAFELEFILRLIETGGLEGLGHISEPLVISDLLTLQDNPQERGLIEQHLRVRGFSAAHVDTRMAGCYELNYNHADAPMVSIVIVIDGQLPHAQRCLDSLLGQTLYSRYELLLLDRGNEESTLCDWLSGIEQLDVDNIQVLRFSSSASVEAIRNQAASGARGDVLLFLDCAIGVIEQGWLQQLLNHVMRPEVGCVGAKLIDADGKLRHAGLLTGLGGTVGRPLLGQSADTAGYMLRGQVDQNYSAVSGQCLMLRQELFLALGGFDEELAPWADVDLCLKAQQTGYLNVWTPRVKLLVSESESPAASPEQQYRLYERWLPQLARDPAYNLNFSLATGAAFKLADSKLSWRPLAACKALPTVLAYPGTQGAPGGRRVIQSFNALHEAGLIDGRLSSALLTMVELERYSADVIVMAQPVSDSNLEAMRRMGAFSKAFKIYDTSEYPSLSEQALSTLYQGLSYMDRLVVNSEAMAQAFKGFHSDIRVFSPHLSPGDWGGLDSQRRCADQPRIGWAGGIGDASELDMLANVVKDLAGEVQWVVLGPCPDHLRPFVHECHGNVDIASYPKKLASLNLDLALAPLGDSSASRFKTPLRLLEYGACGYPVICSDVEAYRIDLPIMRVNNSYEAWMDGIRAFLSDLDAAAQVGDALRERVGRNWTLTGPALLVSRDIWLPD
ncbi:Glycosyltransferase, GT2 family [Pseudomonas sp. NFACC23-1]|uniref:glycosyltransferase n=1 Tax=unclassified Pseudomonas TaxID=196821 RepID=UPI00088936EA|nr:MULTISPECIES: glycosyltransferase [unclassified Pseudomonas]SDB40054.1 Glycosyltransferase, GT2 family [Pseudomonas sp. NFACC17-2]SEJ09307.1 Glycosyltransferase, GT2 family [Pseudomonas sp. NFACC23-1]SFW44004.1 Glycosyltransferase, GT2 family [Pseudomonas sp. NFACC16-2]